MKEPIKDLKQLREHMQVQNQKQIYNPPKIRKTQAR